MAWEKVTLSWAFGISTPWAVGTSISIGASHQIRFRRQVEKHRVHLLLSSGWASEVHGCYVEGFGLVSVGGKVFKWVIDRTRVDVDLKTSAPTVKGVGGQ